MSENEEIKYVVGDLLWAKIGKYPYWPCMVSYDPFEGCYFKKKKVRSVESTIYHVQYFGKQVQHGWTSPGLIFPFEGEEKYHAKKKELIQNAKDTAKKKVTKYDVAAGSYKAWILSVKEAEEALAVELHERYESFVFKYEFDLKRCASGKDVSSTSKKKTKMEESLMATAGVVSYGPEKFCKICEKAETDLMCSGVCEQYFHKDCLGLVVAPDTFQCFNCELGIYNCIVCKNADASTVKCSKCNTFYHEKCIKKYPCYNMEKNICPYHTCLTCYNANPRNVLYKEPSKRAFIHCLRCPTAFHASLHCTPVGGVVMSKEWSSIMICPEHFLGKNKVSPQVTSNISYCAVCSEGGELICCESCPYSYHIACTNTAEIPTGDFFCEDCVNRQYLHVGMLVWAKTGHFRWWPAQIVVVNKLPPNVKNMERYDGEFPVQYFGTDEYFWTHRGRVIPYDAHHKNYCVTGSKQRKLNSYFKLGLEEASEAYDQYISLRQKNNLKGQKPAYKHIKVNRAIPPAMIVHTGGKSVLPCFCNPSKSSPCSIDSGCLNRSMLMECHPDVCLAGERCENQNFQKRIYAKVERFISERCGWGLRASEYIAKGTFVIEYVGEVITHDLYRERAKILQNIKDYIPNYYFLYLDSRRMIDAGPQGNLSRFINHSCDPNCEMLKWSVCGDSRIGIFALRNINPAEELTFNYRSDAVPFSQKCYCNSDKCQEFIGRSPVNRYRQLQRKVLQEMFGKS